MTTSRCDDRWPAPRPVATRRGVWGQQTGRAAALFLALAAGPVVADGVLPDGWQLGVIGFDHGFSEFAEVPEDAGDPRVAVFVMEGADRADWRALADAFPFETACNEVAELLATMGGADEKIEIVARVRSGGRTFSWSRALSQTFDVAGGICLSQGGTDL